MTKREEPWMTPDEVLATYNVRLEPAPKGWLLRFRQRKLKLPHFPALEGKSRSSAELIMRIAELPQYEAAIQTHLGPAWDELSESCSQAAAAACFC